jgi:hypothetical protein
MFTSLGANVATPVCWYWHRANGGRPAATRLNHRLPSSPWAECNFSPQCRAGKTLCPSIPFSSKQ